jgi:molecular chaperone IbpA
MPLYTFQSNLKGYHDYTIGFDRIFDSLNQFTLPEPNFPRYDLIEEDGNIRLEMPLSGYSKDKLKVYTVENVLTVEAYKGEENDKVRYIHRGIARRSFTWKRVIPDSLLVKSATFEDGLLTVVLEKIVPDKSTTRKEYL